jgi:putative nucleotidyltransferase with HDIG domain
MSRDNSKPLIRARTEDLRKEIEAASGEWHRPLRSRTFVSAAIVWGVFVLVVGAVVAWTREQPLVAEGRVMSETAVAPVAFEIVDDAATEQERSQAKARTPRVYIRTGGSIEEIVKGVEALPKICQSVKTADEIEVGIRTQFGIDDKTLEAMKQFVTGGEITDAWRRNAARLRSVLYSNPIISSENYRLESVAQNRMVELRAGGEGASPAATAQEDGLRVFVPSSNAIDVESATIADAIRDRARGAGYTGAGLDVVVTRITTGIKPTYVFDPALTAERQAKAVTDVSARLVSYPAGEVIFRRGDVLTATQADLYRESMVRGKGAEPAWQTWGRRLSSVGIVGAIALAFAGYTVLFVPRMRRNPARMAAAAGLAGALALLACYLTAIEPAFVALTAVAPTVLCAVIFGIAYNQRVAMAFGALHGLLVCAALDLPVGFFAILVTGVGVSVWKLREVRDREALISMGAWVAVALALGTMLAGVVELPMSWVSIRQTLRDAGLAAFGGLLVAGLALFILPTLEKTFGIMTGMTLIELRDPKQPLLRQLQQRAPGTYNHSLNLAALGEAAAEAIGADGLLTYVGALYHDIGKMNKPDYFVENQTPGFNRHDKLTPAMSLLIIVGHVKDGVELAREFNLPRPLWHFIESHHGTTLVEYFYHRARRQAEAASFAAGGGSVPGVESGSAPSEIEYRYPGPKPRTKEAAIIMLCDAVESASRTISDPTPGRIEALVQAIATKRLMDGQFDECDLTLRELSTIADAVSKTLASIYHGRIAYPGESERVAGDKTRTIPVVGTIPAPAARVGAAAAIGSGNVAGIAALTTPVRVGGATTNQDATER